MKSSSLIIKWYFGNPVLLEGRRKLTDTARRPQLESGPPSGHETVNEFQLVWELVAHLWVWVWVWGEG